VRHPPLTSPAAKYLTGLRSYPDNRGEVRLPARGTPMSHASVGIHKPSALE